MKKILLALLTVLVFALPANATYITGTLNIPQFNGDIYYVDAAQSDDTGDGLTAGTAKKTIQAAIDAGAIGDAITIKAGTYTEAVTLNKNSMELWCEIGTIIQAPVTSIALTISGDYCKVICENGTIRINAVEDYAAVLVSGDWNYLTNVRVPGNGLVSICTEITGNGNVLTNVRCASPKVAAIKISGDKVKVQDGCTGGTVAGSKGVWVTSTADKCRLKNYASQGHSAGGFYIETGATNGESIGCVSGGGDGARYDPSNAFAWMDYHFDDVIYVSTDFSAGGPTSYDLFTVSGAVRIYDFWGEVTTQLSDTACTFQIILYSAGGQVALTAASASAANAVAGAMFVRNAPSDEALDFGNPSGAPVIVENVSTKNPKVAIDIVEGAATTTIRLIISADLAAGVVKWHCTYMPLSSDGFLQ